MCSAHTDGWQQSAALLSSTVHHAHYPYHMSLAMERLPPLPPQALEAFALQLLDPGLDAILRLVVLIVLIQRQPTEGALVQ